VKLRCLSSASFSSSSRASPYQSFDDRRRRKEDAAQSGSVRGSGRQAWRRSDGGGGRTTACALAIAALGIYSGGRVRRVSHLNVRAWTTRPGSTPIEHKGRDSKGRASVLDPPLEAAGARRASARACRERRPRRSGAAVSLGVRALCGVCPNRFPSASPCPHALNRTRKLSAEHIVRSDSRTAHLVVRSCSYRPTKGTW
jgi:hypothetical protein